jgi:hypothetical protein
LVTNWDDLHHVSGFFIVISSITTTSGDEEKTNGHAARHRFTCLKSVLGIGKMIRQRPSDFRDHLSVLNVSYIFIVSDFFQSIKRVMKNKIVLLDSLSSVCTKIGLAAFEIFLPKYIESQYGVSASDSNLLVGNFPCHADRQLLPGF